jgi:glycerol kinase
VEPHQGEVHVTDLTNACVTGIIDLAGRGWDAEALAKLAIPASILPTIVDSTGEVGRATALPGSPPITGLAGDQQASLIGQGCVTPGPAKITFGTGGMLDTVIGADRPGFSTRGGGGTFPIIAWSQAGRAVWGLEAIMLSAGTNVEWLRADLGIIDSAAASHEVAQQVESTDGVVYVPALLGLGTPKWDYGARGTLLGVMRGTTRAHIVRAALEAWPNAAPISSTPPRPTAAPPSTSSASTVA